MSRHIKTSKLSMLELMNRSRPRPEIRPRPTVFQDKTKYSRNREKQFIRQSINNR